MTDVVEPRRHWWSGLPRWGRIGLIAGAVVILTLAAIVAVRLIGKAPSIPLGPTAVADLREGSCLAEADHALESYTVVSCAAPHAQQVFATASVEVADSIYATVSSALGAFGDSVCDHYKEYRLFLQEHLHTDDFDAYALDVPTPDEYAAGDTTALCVIVPSDGATMIGDVYRQMP